MPRNTPWVEREWLSWTKWTLWPMATAYYAPQDEHTLAWDDPRVAIDWPIEAGRAPQVSAKDQAGARLADAPLY